uniref:beta-N-acetylhexosaminidase n=1 Tax=Ningiella ruwaisensis TaxID=2364274 RepID=UPI00109F4A3E|nr:beta-N-acetylhexosaminidase [Ningiella ruwaisensis]
MAQNLNFDTAPTNAIVGVSGTVLSTDERALFKEIRPAGMILFARNIDSPSQLRELTNSFKEITDNPYALILIDQEGGRVSRLPKPHWRIPPSPTRFAALYQRSKQAALKACELNYQLIGDDLKKMGINVNCAPMLDIPQKNASTVVTDRALGDSPEQVIALGHATIAGLKHCGVEPVIKHAPGHGRATLDSHKALPRVDDSLKSLAEWDFLPFAHFSQETMLMTAHILYSDIDKNVPGTLSSKVINNVIRKHLNFDGLIMTDDIDMHALQGSTYEKAKNALSAGCDLVLQCSGRFEDLKDLSASLEVLSGRALERYINACKSASKPANEIDNEAVLAEMSDIFATHAIATD